MDTMTDTETDTMTDTDTDTDKDTDTDMDTDTDTDTDTYKLFSCGTCVYVCKHIKFYVSAWLNQKAKW
jgi:hypothetical protein